MSGNAVAKKMPAPVLRPDGAPEPLDVMLANMDFWIGAAERLGQRLVELAHSSNFAEQRTEVMSIARELLAARDKAERCAVDAAPYRHPKLTSVEHGGPGGAPIPLEVTLVKRIVVDPRGTED